MTHRAESIDLRRAGPTPPERPTPRRAVLRAGALLGTAAWAAACSAESPGATVPASSGTPAPPPTAAGEVTPAPDGSGPARTLLVYFSRPGENYFNGGRIDLEVGNTEVLAGMIAAAVDCDVHRIEAADPYSDSYDDTVARNGREQDEDARPAIANPLASVADYDTVLVGSPVWNVRPPLIMATFAESHDLAGKDVVPFVTYAVSGLGRAERDYADWCPGARIGEGLAVRGEEVAEHDADVRAWLQGIGLLEV